MHNIKYCDLCGSLNARFARKVVHERANNEGPFAYLTIVRCTKCQFIFQLEEYSEEMLRQLYSNDTSYDLSLKNHFKSKAGKHLKERQDVISTALVGIYGEGLGPFSVLDVGGGLGECTQHLADHHNVCVSDFNSESPTHPSIQKLDMIFPWGEHNKFDLIVINHVLEHVFSPTTLLTASNYALRLGGRIVVEVPFELYTPLVFKHLGDWRHVGYFSKITLKNYLKKAGFRILSLTLEDGCYGERRLPVIRAVGEKVSSITKVNFKVHYKSLIHDMVTPAVLSKFIMRKLTRK